MIFVSGLVGRPLNGNCFQNSGDPCPPYLTSSGMLGFFSSPSVLIGSVVAVAGEDAKSQNITTDHLDGRPKSSRDAGIGNPKTTRSTIVQNVNLHCANYYVEKTGVGCSEHYSVFGSCFLGGFVVFTLLYVTVP